MTSPPFRIESDLEARICADPEWQAGAEWGVPRPGHPEGQVKFHVADVLANVDRYARTPAERQKLRLVALVHDTFKHRVDPDRPRAGENHHGKIARRFVERYVDDDTVLEIIELHDEAYSAWRTGARRGRWREAEERARRLLDRLGPHRTALYVTFFRCDNETGTKRPDPWEWFARLAGREGEDAA